MNKIKNSVIAFLVGCKIISDISKETEEIYEYHWGKKLFWGTRLMIGISNILMIPFDIFVNLLLKVLTPPKTRENKK